MREKRLLVHFVVRDSVEAFRRLRATRAMTTSTATITRTTAVSFVTDDMAIGSVRL